MSEINFISLDKLKDKLITRKYQYFSTIKPPRGEPREKQFNDFLDYLVKRNVDFWYVQCKSETGYIHYHGIVSMPNDMLEDKVANFKMAFQKRVNREIGFHYPLQRVDSVSDIYKYVMNQKNNNPQQEYKILS